MLPRPSTPRPRRGRKRGRRRAGLLLVGLLITVGCGSPSGPDAGEAGGNGEVGGNGIATVVEVIDGDTVVVRVADHTEHVRLIGIDTPETPGGFLPEECYGEEASAFTRSLLPAGTAVSLTRDTEARDRYGRLLAYLHRTDDGLFVNLEIAAQGYAEALSIEPNTIHAAAFRSAEAAARDRGLGLWTACGSADVVIQ
ncbi:thermonuclease family protein [Candidatus Poriferisocius sp.]|uniref:thermonuclease family protein n=1 Tax=Candidatus Poriferisocius sp. TaxID=3101276 RepID=UPI003B596C4E